MGTGDGPSDLTTRLIKSSSLPQESFSFGTDTAWVVFTSDGSVTDDGLEMTFYDGKKLLTKVCAILEQFKYLSFCLSDKNFIISQNCFKVFLFECFHGLNILLLYYKTVFICRLLCHRECDRRNGFNLLAGLWWRLLQPPVVPVDDHCRRPLRGQTGLPVF